MSADFSWLWFRRRYPLIFGFLLLNWTNLVEGRPQNVKRTDALDFIMEHISEILKLFDKAFVCLWSEKWMMRPICLHYAASYVSALNRSWMKAVWMEAGVMEAVWMKCFELDGWRLDAVRWRLEGWMLKMEAVWVESTWMYKGCLMLSVWHGHQQPTSRQAFEKSCKTE